MRIDKSIWLHKSCLMTFESAHSHFLSQAAQSPAEPHCLQLKQDMLHRLQSLGAANQCHCLIQRLTFWNQYRYSDIHCWQGYAPDHCFYNSQNHLPRFLQGYPQCFEHLSQPSAYGYPHIPSSAHWIDSTWLQHPSVFLLHQLQTSFYFLCLRCCSMPV